jgi:DNA-binding CsgD family transcriptional regulator
MASQVQLPDAVAIEAILGSDAWRALVRKLRLSKREAEIVGWILRHADDELSIATRMQISSHTVHTHLERLYRKLEVSSRSQLMAVIFVAYAALNRSAV